MEHQNQGKSSTGMEANIAALLSYLLGFISGSIFYAIERKNKFVRFHAMQSTMVFAFLFILNVLAKLLPSIGWPISTLLGIIGIVIWIFLMIKAYTGEYFKLPVIGDIAERSS